MNQAPSRAIVTGLHADRRPALKSVVKRPYVLHPTVWLLGFVLTEMACQIALLFSAIGSLRVFVRTFAFAGSFFFLFLLRRGPRNHPSAEYAVLAIAITILSIANPGLNTLLGGIATVIFAASLLGPLFWVPRVRVDVRSVRALCLLFWGFNSLSALFGALQVYYPGRFEPSTSVMMSESMQGVLHITLADGTSIPRPMGLTDIPGGAAVGASLAIVFAAAFLLDRPNIVFRLVLFASIGVSAFSIYLSQVRSALVITAISLLALALPMLRQRRPARFFVLVGAIVGIAVLAFLVAEDIGGQMVTKRFSSLVADDPETVYYTNRGVQLQATFMDLIPRYPLGAGLGRWGMIFAYFGDPYNSASPPLWAELNWTGWVYDGGVLLVLAYAGALIMLFVTGVRLSIRVDDRPGRDLYKWATLHVAHAMGIIAATFSAAPFSSTAGIDCFLLGAAVFAAGQQLDAASGVPSSTG
jgi:hypothetical protein